MTRRRRRSTFRGFLIELAMLLILVAGFMAFLRAGGATVVGEWAADQIRIGPTPAVSTTR